MFSTEDTVWNTLKSMNDPKRGVNIVSSGVVQNISIVQDKAMIRLSRPEAEEFEHQAISRAIERKIIALHGINRVTVSWDKPAKKQSDFVDHGRDGISLNVLSENETAMGHGIAEDIGYGEFGPDQIVSPEAEIPNEPWEGFPPVLQWDIDPTNDEIESGESTVQLLDWHFEIWWQKHPDDLLYVAIQAIQEDDTLEGPQRKHPVGRNVVVNLVYDINRYSVISIYGTACDFRPFVEAFQIGCNIPIPQDKEQVTTTAPKNNSQKENKR
jgi:metal-sulfur cluster biosynthetic enzyme